MGETPLNVVIDNISTNQENILKNSHNSDGIDSILLSDSATFSQNSNPDCSNDCLNDGFKLSFNNEEDLLNLIHFQSFENYFKSSDSTLLRRYSCPCFNSEYNLNGFNVSENLNNYSAEKSTTRTLKSKSFNKYYGSDNTKFCNHLRNNTWGSLIYKFKKFCLETNKNNINKPINLITDSNTSLKTSTDLTSKTLDKPLKASNGDTIQYAVFKPINIEINNKTHSLNGFVKNKEDKEDIVFVVKSNKGQPITKYGLTRIINCTKRQEYEVVEHNTGDYFLLKLTNDINIFKIYEIVFDQPHPNIVEVIQLLTNIDSNNLNNSKFKTKNEQIYYILLNSFKYTSLSDYHINTIPSLIDLKVLKLIMKGLLKAIVYLHSKSLTLSKLTMNSVIICKTHDLEFENGDEMIAKIVDLDDAKICKSKKDLQNDIKLVGNLLFTFIEGKQIENNHKFKSNLWTVCPQMFDFCITALAKFSMFNSANEALIHPWITSPN